MPVYSPDIVASSSAHSTASTISQAANETFDSFTRFHRLPLELRLAIWALALPGPRVLWLCPATDHSHTEVNSCCFWAYLDAYSILTTHPMQREYCSLIPPISMLQACKESREVAVGALPHKFPSRTGQEIRFGNLDSVLFDSLRIQLLREASHSQAVDPRFHSALREIRTLILTDLPKFPDHELVVFSSVLKLCPYFTNLKTIFVTYDAAPISYTEDAVPELNLDEFASGEFDLSLLNHYEFGIYEKFQELKEEFVVWGKEEGTWADPNNEIKLLARNWSLRV